MVGGPGAFVIAVTETSQMAVAIRRKLVLEIAGARPRLLPAAAHARRATSDCLIGEKIRRARDFE